jgi:hypothetical protein
MTQPTVIYPKLKYFFSAYFHADWKSMYDWQGNKPSYAVVVNEFKTENPAATVNQTIKELEELLYQDLSDHELHNFIVYALGANFRPAGLNLTCQQWLRHILDILKS